MHDRPRIDRHGLYLILQQFLDDESVAAAG
jgi:hypothetical protein